MYERSIIMHDENYHCCRRRLGHKYARPASQAPAFPLEHTSAGSAWLLHAIRMKRAGWLMSVMVVCRLLAFIFVCENDDETR
jgi:hypothetical protein